MLPSPRTPPVPRFGAPSWRARAALVALLALTTVGPAQAAQASRIEPAAATSISIGNASIAEGDSGLQALHFPVTLSRKSMTPVRFFLKTFDSSADAASGDYDRQDGTVWEIPAGQLGTDVVVWVRGDTRREPDETFVVNLYGGSVAFADNEAIGTILNDEPPPPTVDIGDASADEGQMGLQAMDFALTLSHASKEPVSVDFGASSCGSGPQADIRDYRLPYSTRVVIPAGALTATLTMGIVGDNWLEPDEQFCVTLFQSDGGVLGDGIGMGTILNDDAVPVLSIYDGSVVESNAPSLGLVLFTVALSSPSSTPVTFDVVTEPGTATPGVDFVSTTLTSVSFAPGLVLQIVAITVPGDAEVEADETFTLNARNVVGATFEKAQGRGTIVNDDKAILSIADASVVEGDDGTRTATFMVALSQPMPTPVTFDVATFDGTAVAGADYLGKAQSAKLIDAGRTRAVFEVAIQGDVAEEPDEQFEVQVSRVNGAQSGDLFAVGTIQDDDPSAQLSAALGVFALQDRGVAVGDAELRLAESAHAVCTLAANPVILAVGGMHGEEDLADLAAAVNSGAGNVLHPGTCDEDPNYKPFLDSRSPGLQDAGLLVSTLPVRPGVPRVELRSLASLGAEAVFAPSRGARERLFESSPLLAQVRINAQDGSFLDVAAIFLPTGARDRARRAMQSRAITAAVRAHLRAQPRLPMLVLGDVDGMAPTLVELLPAAASRAINGGRIWIDPRLLAEFANSRASSVDAMTVLKLRKP